VVWNQHIRGGLQMVILKELGETLRDAWWWLAGGCGAQNSAYLERGCEGRGRERWCWEGRGVYCTDGDGAAKTQNMLPQEYTAVKDNLLMKRKGLGGGGGSGEFGPVGSRARGNGQLTLPMPQAWLFRAGSSSPQIPWMCRCDLASAIDMLGPCTPALFVVCSRRHCPL
jgi:hypothetical protein